MARNVCQRERFASHTHAVIIVVAALLALVLQNRNIHGDFYVRIIVTDLILNVLFPKLRS
jgi:hypothetical protein